MTKLRNLVGDRIRAIRKAKGLTQQQLAELSGLDDAYIGSVERGERNFSIDTLDKIVLGLNISAYELLYNHNEKEINAVRQEAIDQYITIISEFNTKQLESVRIIVHELYEAIRK